MPVRMVTLAGPWSGIEERERFQDESSASISMNVDYSRGFIEGRPGAETIAHIADNDTIAYRTQLFIYKPVLGDPRILVCGAKLDPENHNLSTAEVVFRVFNMQGHPMGPLQNLTTDLSEPPDKSFTCSFTNAIVSTASFESRHAVVITTVYGSYVYEPVESESTVRRLDPETDGFRDNAASVSYLMHSPCGRAVKRHLTMFFFGGLKRKQHCPLSSPLEAEQNAMAEHLISAGRAEVQFSPEILIYSEPEHIGDYPYTSHEVVEIGERITGLESHLDTLVIFTDRGIYNLSAVSPENFMTTKTVNNVGCIAPGSVVSVGDVIYFMGVDGIYAYAGSGQQGAVAKVSEPINSIFGGDPTTTHLPEATLITYGAFPALMKLYGWPWKIDKGAMHLCQAMHVTSMNQIWWSIPVRGEYSEKFLATLVFDYKQKSWSIYTGTQQTNNTESKPFFYSGDTMRAPGGELVYFTDSIGRIKKLLRRGDIDKDRAGVSGLSLLGPSGEGRAPHMVWMSGRILADNEIVSTLRPIRIRCLGGHDGTTGHIVCLCEGEESHSDAVYLVDGGAVAATAIADRQLSAVGVDTVNNVVLHRLGDDAKKLKHFYNASGSYAQWTNGTSSGTTTFKWAGTDWISKKIEVGSIRSKSFRITLIDGPKPTLAALARGGILVVDRISLELDSGGPPVDTR